MPPTNGPSWGEKGDLPDDVMAYATIGDRAEWFDFLRRLRKWGRGSSFLARAQWSFCGVILGDGRQLLNLWRGIVDTWDCGNAPPF